MQQRYFCFTNYYYYYTVFSFLKKKITKKKMVYDRDVYMIEMVLVTFYFREEADGNM